MRMTLRNGWAGPPRVPFAYLDRATRLGILAVRGRHRAGTSWMLQLRRELLSLATERVASQLAQVDDCRYLLAGELIDARRYSEAVRVLDDMSAPHPWPVPGAVELRRGQALIGIDDLDGARIALRSSHEASRSAGSRSDEAGVLLAELEARTGDRVAGYWWAEHVLEAMAGFEPVFPDLADRLEEILTSPDSRASMPSVADRPRCACAPRTGAS